MKRFSIVNSGYDVDEVNRFIDIVINRLEKLNNENEAYKEKIAKLNTELENKATNNVDTSKLEKAIFAIQETSDRIKKASEEEARVIVEEAKNNANSIVHEALINAEKTEQKRLLLEKNMKIYKERMRALVESQLNIVDDLDNIEL